MYNLLHQEQEPRFIFPGKESVTFENHLHLLATLIFGLIFKEIGIPNNMFTVMFAIARTVGWVAQWMEMIGEDNQRIGRPRQSYVGPAARDYTDINKR